jgi:SAM-dependent methyltransferase
MKKNRPKIKIDPGSFKDPDGGVFFYKNKVYRSVAGDCAKFYQNFVNSDFFKELVGKKIFIPSRLVELKHDSIVVEKFGHQKKFFEHNLLEFLTYPFEWSASMLIDAGIHTLDLQKKLLRENLSLKDATPYNIQYNLNKPIFIDLCSVEKASTNGVWIAFNQFCQTFFYPLLMSEFGVCNLNSIFLSHMDGLTLDEIFEALKFRPFWKKGLIVDYLFPALFLKLKHYKILNIGKKPVSTQRTIRNSAQIQIHTVRRLKKGLLKISPQKATSQWVDYTRSCSYTDEDYSVKKEFIKSFLNKFQPSKVLDLGCNIGDFSIMAAKHGSKVISVDSDHDCINYLYNVSKEANYKILPLCINIANPSPSIGWLNEERPSFLERISGKFDCVFALALIHHLIITNRVPLKEAFRLLNDCTSNYLVIEYIGKEDKKFQELMFNRTENYDDFDIGQFEKAASTYFLAQKKVRIINKDENLERCLYLMKKLT